MAANPFDIAKSMLGKGEVPDRATLQEFMRNGGANLDPVTTAWCAAFVNASLGQAGQQGTGSNLARSFLKWGEAVDTPQRGDVAVFSRGDPKSIYGHVGFFDSYAPDGRINVLGGNQSDHVSVSPYDTSRLLGFRRAGAGGAPQAPGTPAPQLSAPQIVADKPVAASAPIAPGASAPQRVFGDMVAPQAPVSFANIIDSYAQRRRAEEEEQQARQARLAALFSQLPA